MSCGDDEEDEKRVYRSLSTAFFFLRLIKFVKKSERVVMDDRRSGPRLTRTVETEKTE